MHQSTGNQRINSAHEIAPLKKTTFTYEKKRVSLGKRFVLN
jgi:hypothetical protein